MNPGLPRARCRRFREKSAANYRLATDGPFKRISPSRFGPRPTTGAAEVIGGLYNDDPMPAFSIAKMIGPLIHLSPLILVTLLLMLAASVWVFATLVRRETIRRRRLATRAWAASRGLRVLDPGAPESAAAVHLPRELVSKIDAVIAGSDTVLARLVLNDPKAKPIAPPHWHLLLRRIEGVWPPTALRPVAHARSIADFFSLTSFPSLGSLQRFVIFGAENAAARALSASLAATIVPPDVGLLLHGSDLIFDFSSRHFDEIAFDRILELADQLIPRLNAARQLA